MWIVKRRTTASYLGAYEWVRTQKDAVRFGSRRAARAACATASEQNSDVRVLRLSPARVCPVHAFQRHGKEAEELRAGVEKVIEEFDNDEGHAGRRAVCGVLRALLDRVDARDSLSYLERRDDEDEACDDCGEPVEVVRPGKTQCACG